MLTLLIPSRGEADVRPVHDSKFATAMPKTSARHPDEGNSNASICRYITNGKAEREIRPRLNTDGHGVKKFWFGEDTAR